MNISKNDLKATSKLGSLGKYLKKDIYIDKIKINQKDKEIHISENIFQEDIEDEKRNSISLETSKQENVNPL
jgi:sorbitol-specific phosphotransferase system component IIBC